MSKVMVIVNPSSGKEKAKELLPQIESVLRGLYDEVVICKTEKEDDATHFAQNACENKFNAVISMGGDGTVSETVNGTAEQEHRPDLGIIPLGTVNDFARALHIPLKPEDAIEMLKFKHTKQADIGKINGRYFMNVLAIGAIAEATYNVTVEQKTRFGSLAYLFEGAKALISKTPFPLNIKHEKGIWTGDALLVVCTMTNSVGGFESLAPEAKVNDGVLHTFVIKNLSLSLVLKIIPSLLKGEIKEHEQVEYIQSSSLYISSPETLAVNIDGDEGVRLPFEAKVLNNHLHLFIPISEETG